MLHVPRREELTLLDVDRAARMRRGDKQIGLAAEKSGNLQHVDRLRGDRALRGLVHVGEHGKAERLANFREDRQRGGEADAPRAGARGAVGLVVGGLEDEADLAPSRDLLQRARHFQRMCAAFQLAGAGDQRERKLCAEAHSARAVADFDDGVNRHEAPQARAAAHPAASPRQ